MPQARRVLIVYSGGTIGMQQGENGLVAAGGFAHKLRQRQQQQARANPLPQWCWRELASPLDSASIGPRHWLALRHLLVNALQEEQCDAALLLHGTDTMAYSAAALSFLLLGLPQPLLLTGSMLPADAPQSDAWDNLFGALLRLQQGVPAGVWLYFGGQLLPGVRAYKRSSTDMQAFAERPSATAGSKKGAARSHPSALDWRKERKPTGIAVQPLYPGLRASSLRAVLASGIKALILECYGSGTVPEDASLLAALQAGAAKGVLLLAISQCPQGEVQLSQYAASQALQQIGVLSGGALGREAALGKLFALLGAGLSAAEAKYWFAQNLCGEWG